MPNQKRRNCVCWSSSNQGRSQARSRKNKSCTSHDQTIQHERVKNISWVYPISRKVFTQYGRSQRTTSKIGGKEHSMALEKQQEDSFQQLKRMATSAPVLSYYDPKKPVTLSIDASSKGLGAVLYQEEKPVASASRASTPTQQKYAQIEIYLVQPSFTSSCLEKKYLSHQNTNHWNIYSISLCTKHHFVYRKCC